MKSDINIQLKKIGILYNGQYYNKFMNECIDFIENHEFDSRILEYFYKSAIKIHPYNSYEIKTLINKLHTSNENIIHSAIVTEYCMVVLKSNEKALNIVNNCLKLKPDNIACIFLKIVILSELKKDYNEIWCFTKLFLMSINNKKVDCHFEYEYEDKEIIVRDILISAVEKIIFQNF